MPRKNPKEMRERTVIMFASRCRGTPGRASPAWNPRLARIPGADLAQGLPYGLMVWGGTAEIVFLHTTESIRQDPTLPPSAGVVIRVVPVVTSGGTRLV